MSNEKELEGGCLCGRVRFKISGPPLVVTHCHCSMCRRRRRSRAACGTSLSFERDDRAGEIDVTAATLDDPEAVRPQDHIYWGSRLSWAVPADGLPTLPRGHRDHGYPKG